MSDLKQDLSKARFSNAVETLEDAQFNFEAGKYKIANNRAYYSIFHAIRSVLALEGFDSKKHSAILAKFNTDYIHKGLIGSEIKGFYRKIELCETIRNHSDYDDFYIATKEQAAEQIAIAREVLSEIKDFLEQNYTNN